MQVALPVQPGVLVAGDFLDQQTRLGRANVHHRLDLEAIAVQVELGQVLRPERVVAVTEVRVTRAEKEVNKGAEDPVAPVPRKRYFVPAAAPREARSLSGGGAGGKRGNKAGDFQAVGGPVGVH